MVACCLQIATVSSTARCNRFGHVSARAVYSNKIALVTRRRTRSNNWAMSIRMDEIDDSDRFSSHRVNYLKHGDIHHTPQITGTGNLKNCYPSIDCECFVYTVETLDSKGDWSSNIHLHHLDTLKSYPITRTGNCHNPVIAAGL